MTHAGLARTTYVSCCELLNRTPDLTLSPSARAASLPSWMSIPEMLTPAARPKLHAWARSPQATEAPTETDILGDMVFVGDEVLAARTARVLSERVPPPVRDYALARAVFIGIGPRVRGFCSATRLSQAPRAWLIVLGERASNEKRFENLVGHELAHAWSLAEPGPEIVAGPAIWQSAWLYTPAASVPAPAVVEAATRRRANDHDEQLADRLAKAWGFRKVR